MSSDDISNVLTYTAEAFIVLYTGPISWAIPAALTVLTASSVYGAEQAKKAARTAEQQAKDAYNASLKDRTATSVSSDAPFRYVYGRARVGSDIVAIFTGGDKDQYKYMVCVHAAHECDAIEEIYVAGKALGALDGYGYVTSASPDYYIPGTTSVVAESHTGTSFTLNNLPVAGTLRITYVKSTYKNGHLVYSVVALTEGVDYTRSGASISGIAVSRTYSCHYELVDNKSTVRVISHLGADGDTVDTLLHSLFPGKWPATSVLRGFCYSVVQLNLNQAEFQGGPPAIEVLLRGKKLYDPRDSSTAWSTNNALVAYDYLTSDLCGVDSGDLPVADFITAANVCDEDIGSGVKRYECNGTTTSNQDPRDMIESLAQSMAGIVVGTTWHIQAGKYVAPIADLDQSDIVGQLSIIAGSPDSDLYNGVKGQYTGPETKYVVSDIKPYQNGVYVGADNGEKWTSIDFPFTDNIQHIWNLCRIFTEDQRNGFTVKAAFSLKAWSLKVGDRITFTSSLLGQTAKVYRITDKNFGMRQTVELTLKEDAESIWDLEDAVVADETPNTEISNPWQIAVPGNLQLAEELYQTSGSVGVRSKVILSWDAADGVSSAIYEVQYKAYESGIWIDLPNISALNIDIFDLAAGKYDFRARTKSMLLGSISAWTSINTFSVYGLMALPFDVAGFNCVAMNGLCYATWQLSVDLDVRIGGRVQIRRTPLTSGATFSGGFTVQELNGDAVSAVLPLATGTYMAKFIDSSGNFSGGTATFVMTEALMTGWTTVVNSVQNPDFTGAKTGCLLSSPNLIMDSDYTAIYEYDDTLDCGSIAVRRFHGHILLNAYTADDLFDSADLFDSGDAFDESDVVNGCNAWQEVRVCDDIDASPQVWSDWAQFDVADFSCRYAQVRLQMVRDTLQNNIEIEELATVIKIPA